MFIQAPNNQTFMNGPTQFVTGLNQPGALGFAPNPNSGMVPFEASLFFKMMQVMQMLQSGFGAFGGQMATPMQNMMPSGPSLAPQGQASRPAPPTAWSAALAPQNQAQVTSQTSPQDSRPSTSGEIKQVENQLERISNHWVEILPEGHSNPQGLMLRLNKGGVTVPFDPSIPAKDINLVLLDTNNRPAAGIHNIEKYWEARTPNGLDRSILAEVMRYQDQPESIQERYNDDAVRRMAVDGTASEIYPGEHVPHGATNSRVHKDHYANYSSLNSFTSKRHEDKSLEEQQNLHESAKFAIASATFLESGGNFDDKALDAFLAESLKIDSVESDSADGPRGERLAKLGEVTRAIIDGKIEIEDAVDSGIVPEDQLNKFDASVLSVESGKIAADVSKVTENSTGAEIRETVAKSKTVGSPSNPTSKNVVRVDS